MNFLHLAIVVVAFMANNSEAKCGSQNRNPRFNRPICSAGGICMEIAENSFSSHVRVHCYDKNNEQIDHLIEWTVNGKWSGSRTNQFSGQNSDCMYLDWGAINGDGPGEYENRKVEVFCIAKNHPKGWQQVQGTVNDGSLEFN